jgi:glycerophosphoryl diester phosphodiesterase
LLILPHKPLVIAHRGASGYAPENTLAAFKAAIDMGADGIEFDVTMSQDREVVVIHDDTLDRTTSGKGTVWEKDAQALQTLDAGSWFAPAFAKQRIPLLTQVLDLVGPDLFLNIEIKYGPFAQDTLAAVFALIMQRRNPDRTLITSFDENVIRQCLESAPELSCGLIFEINNLPRAFSGRWHAVSSHFPLITDSFMQTCRSEGKQVYAWTVNSVDIMKQMVQAGVDGIITNYPDKLIALLDLAANPQ